MDQKYGNLKSNALFYCHEIPKHLASNVHGGSPVNWKKRIFWKYSELSHLNIYSNWVHPRFLRGSRCLILSFLCFVSPFSFGQSNFDLRLLITSTPLVSSNFSSQMVNFVQNGSPGVAHHDIISVKHMMDLLRFVENPGLESSFNGFNLHSV